MRASYSGSGGGPSLNTATRGSAASGTPNNTDWDAPEWKEIIAQVATETEPAKQKTLYARMSDYILDQSWAMPFATNPQILVASSKLKGVTTNQYGAWYFTDAWLDTS
jgi:ABC-type transport system substrate-binding protein